MESADVKSDERRVKYTDTVLIKNSKDKYEDV